MNGGYLAAKLTADHVEQHVTNRKKQFTTHSVLSNTPKLIRSGFTESIAPPSSNKKTAATPTDQLATSTTTSRDNATAVTAAASCPNVAPHPFTPAPMKKKPGRKKKSAEPTAAEPTPSPPVDMATAASSTKPAKKKRKKAKETRRKGDKNWRTNKQTATSSEATTVTAAPMETTAVELTPAELTPALGSDGAPSPDATEDDDLLETWRMHNLSCKNRGTRRLLPGDVLDLTKGDEVAIVIPVDGKDDSEFLKCTRMSFKKRFKSEIMQCSKLKEDHDKNEWFDKLLRDKHTVRRDGQLYCEFTASVTSTSNKNNYVSWSKESVDFAVKNGAGVGLSFHGYEYPFRRLLPFELRLDELIAVEVWKKREDEDSFNSNIYFPEKVKDVDTLGKHLVNHLSFLAGDVTSSYEAMYKYYRGKSDTLKTLLNLEKKKAQKATAETEMAREDNAKQCLENELNEERLREFLLKADRVWYNAIVEHYKKFHCISDELIPEDEYIRLFDEMQSLFPLHAKALLDLCIGNLFWQPLRYNEDTLNDRKKCALSHFFAMTRSRNKSNMIYWAMIETLAVFGKGISQVNTRSSAGKNFCCVLKFALRMVDQIYEKCQPDIKEMLRSEATISFVMDNYQRVMTKRTQTNGKSAITHRATASSVMRHKVAAPALGSVVTSPSGVRFEVRSVVRESPYHLVLRLVFQTNGPMSKQESEVIYHIGNIVSPRFMWPHTDLQWILHPAGLDTARPPITYIHQHVPAMARFKVPHTATDEELLLVNKNKWPRDFRTFLDVGRYQALIHRKERFVQLANYCDFLREKPSVEQVLIHNRTIEDPNTATRTMLTSF